MTVESFEEFTPPSVPSTKTHSTHTHYSAVPQSVSSSPHKPCILGVDEAGRGPVLGSMVYGLAYCTKEFADEELSKTGFADSKTLTAEKRSFLMKEICCDESLVLNLGWCTTSMSAQDISSAMLRPMSRGVYNLNDQAHDTTMALIQGVLDKGVLLTEAYIDTVGPPASYQAKLSKQFPQIKFTVTKKADSLFPIVSAASICAKVTRDMDLKSHDLSEGTWGSGYPSDPKTSVWLKSHVDQVFGWMPVVRFSWQTAKDLVEKEEKGGVECVWADDLKRDSKSVESYFREKQKEKTRCSLVVSSGWYGSQVGSDYF
ncbi:Ribonuclease H2 subunit A [Yarrowia sp. B02]|nr:Ribonuclease H2 subunit A [Yarrowia sp. B02]